MQRSLSKFIKGAWHIIEPETKFLHNWHLDLISEYLEAVSKNQIHRLLITIPPRHMKSISVSVMWPVWEWTTNPYSRWIFASYSSSLSEKHSVDRRTIIESDWYRERWGNVFQMAPDQNAKREFQNDKRGVMIATSVGGTITGKGGNRIVADDIQNPETAYSDAEREASIRFFDQSLSTRLDDKKNGSIVVVMQRLHQSDMAARALELGFEHLSIQSEPEKRITYSLPISGKEVVREEGQLLWEERFDKSILESEKKSLRAMGYACQHQQRPAPQEGGLVKRNSWQFYNGNLPERFDSVVASWDMAFKDEKQSSFVVGQVVAKLKADRYLLAQIRRKMDFVETCNAVIRLRENFPAATKILVEDKANGPAVISALKRKVSGLIPIKPDGSKWARASACTPEIESGNVYLPDPSLHPWVEEFIEEWASAPNCAYWDQIDAFSQALNYFGRAPTPVFF